MRRSELKSAPYNPRVITEAGKRKLRAGLESLGMLGPVTWNKRTGNLVGGHQRLAILDALSDHPDYLLTVAVVDLSDEEEREANILLNNKEAGGQFDFEKLEEMFAAGNMRVEVTGFDPADVYRIFGDSKAIMATTGATEALAEKVRETQRKYEGVVGTRGNERATRDAEEFYLVVIFPSAAVLDGFTERYGLENNRYQDGTVLEGAILAKK